MGSDSGPTGTHPGGTAQGAAGSVADSASSAASSISADCLDRRFRRPGSPARRPAPDPGQPARRRADRLRGRLAHLLPAPGEPPRTGTGRAGQGQGHRAGSTARRRCKASGHRDEGQPAGAGPTGRRVGQVHRHRRRSIPSPTRAATPHRTSRPAPRTPPAPSGTTPPADHQAEGSPWSAWGPFRVPGHDKRDPDWADQDVLVDPESVAAEPGQPARSISSVTGAGRRQVVVSGTDVCVSAACWTDSMMSRTCRASSSPARCGRSCARASARSASP